MVMGDASYSMDIGKVLCNTLDLLGLTRLSAIRTATIIGSLLAALTKADLLFFNVKSFKPKVR